jgi:hypothetical protein
MKKFLITAFLIGFALCGKAQDTLFVKQDTVNEDERQYSKLLKYFLKDRNEVNHLWKLNLINSSILTPCIAYEQRLSKKWSFLIEWNNSLKKLYDNQYFGGFSNDNIVYSTIIPIQLRYYSNINKRSLKGKNTTGFSANYFSFGVTGYYSNILFPYFDDGTDAELILGNKYEIKGLVIAGNIGYGIQRRIGNIGYIDVSTGFGIGKAINSNYKGNVIFIPGIKLELGFAVGSLSFWKK